MLLPELNNVVETSCAETGRSFDRALFTKVGGGYDPEISKLQRKKRRKKLQKRIVKTRTLNNSFKRTILPVKSAVDVASVLEAGMSF